MNGKRLNDVLDRRVRIDAAWRQFRKWAERQNSGLNRLSEMYLAICSVDSDNFSVEQMHISNKEQL